MDYDCIVLSGGSNRGYAMLGCLTKYHERIKSVKRYVGTSVGAIIALLLSVGYNTVEITILSRAVQIEYPPLRDILMTIIGGQGIMDTNPYVQVIGKHLRRRFGFIPTMKELYEITGKELIITGSCITTGKCVYISHETFPDMPCTIAIDISSRLPYIFTPILYDGHLYLDGGLHEHFPLSQIRDGERTLAIYTMGKPHGEVTSISDIHPIRYFWSIINCMIKGRYQSLINEMCRTHLSLTMHMISVKGGYLQTTDDEIIHMFKVGFLSPEYQTS